MKKFEHECHLCGNKELLDQEDPNWLCICQKKPQGMNYLHICSNCNYHRWGNKNSTECSRCIAQNLTKKAVSVKVEPFGDLKNMPKRNRQEMFEKVESINDSIIEAQKQAQINEKREIPDLLRQILAKLDSKPEIDFSSGQYDDSDIDGEIKFDENGEISFV